MAFPDSDILRVYDSSGRLAGVFIPPDVWREIEPLLARKKSGADNTAKDARAMEEFKEFLRFWDFRYPYDPSVECPACGAACSDWRENPAFSLHCASLGGLLVFKCKGCGATVRQKHFKDRRVIEFSPPA